MGNDLRLWKSVTLGGVNWDHRSSLMSALQAHKTTSIDLRFTPHSSEMEMSLSVLFEFFSPLNLDTLRVGKLQPAALLRLCAVRPRNLRVLQVACLLPTELFFNLATLHLLAELEHLELRSMEPLRLPQFSFRSCPAFTPLSFILAAVTHL
jgi:hypothetical protein